MNAVKPLGALFDIVSVIMPLDLQTARSGDFVSLKGHQGVAFVIVKGVGTDGDDPSFTFRQAQDVAGTGVKDLATITQYHEREAVDLAAGTGVWAKVTQTAAAVVAPGDPSAQDQGVYVVQIDAAELDRSNGFDCVTVNCADTGVNAQLGCVIAILYGGRYSSAPEGLGSAIHD